MVNQTLTCIRLIFEHPSIYHAHQNMNNIIYEHSFSLIPLIPHIIRYLHSLPFQWHTILRLINDIIIFYKWFMTPKEWSSQHTHNSISRNPILHELLTEIHIIVNTFFPLVIPWTKVHKLTMIYHSRFYHTLVTIFC